MTKGKENKLCHISQLLSGLEPSLELLFSLVDYFTYSANERMESMCLATLKITEQTKEFFEVRFEEAGKLGSEM